MVDVDVRGSLHPMHRTTSTASGPEHPPAMEVERLANGYGGTLPRDSEARKPAKIADAPAPKEELPAQVSLIYFLAWTNTYMLVVSALLFWTDFLPQFGMYVHTNVVAATPAPASAAAHQCDRVLVTPCRVYQGLGCG